MTLQCVCNILYPLFVGLSIMSCFPISVHPPTQGCSASSPNVVQPSLSEVRIGGYCQAMTYISASYNIY